jgi:hypothetical protein
MYRLIFELSFVFTNDPFNNQVEHELSLVKPNPNILTNSLARLHPLHHRIHFQNMFDNGFLYLYIKKRKIIIIIIMGFCVIFSFYEYRIVPVLFHNE